MVTDCACSIYTTMKEHKSMQLISTQSVSMLCEACEVVPAAFLCKADSASLCAACDEAVHSANPLASRHHRVPLTTNVVDEKPAEDDQELDDDDDDAVSWLLLNPIVKNIDDVNDKALFGAEMGGYFDLEDYDHSSLQSNDDITNWQNHVVPQKSFESDDQYIHVHDSVVPIQQSNTALYDHTSAASFQRNLFWWNQKLEVDVVAESSITAKPSKGSTDLFFSPSTATQMIPPTQLSPMEREARVMRYREKKKTRRFEKTIRYASRKAYAETRPRIKGRFAKRSRDHDEADDEVDQMFPASLLTSEDSYCVVPSFSLCS